MAILPPVFDRQKFLEENFVVYDPINRRCHQDFSGLETRQFIGISEIHNSSILKEAQRLFLIYVIGTQNACLLAEGVQPGISLQGKEIPQWQEIPDTLQLRGADIRKQEDAAIFKKWMLLNRRRIDLNVRDRDCFISSFKNLANSLHAHLHNTDLTQRVLRVPDATLQIAKRLIEEKTQRDKEIAQIAEQMNRLTPEKKTGVSLVKSNDGLFHEIEKGSKQFSKLIAIWGKGHFIREDVLIHRLDQARISYMILLPSAQKMKEAEDEVAWAKGTMEGSILTLQGTKEQISFEVPKFCKTYLDARVQNICLPISEKEPILFNSLTIHTVAQQGKNRWMIPHSGIALFESVPAKDYQESLELLDEVENGILSQSQMMRMNRCISSMLKNILMIKGLSLVSLQTEIISEYKWTPHPNHLVFGFSFSTHLSLQWSKGECIGYASFLLHEMKRLQITKYSVAPNDMLIFMDLSNTEIGRFLQSPNQFLDWLESKSPPHSQLKIDGDITLQSATLGQGNLAQKGLALITKTGFTLTLT